MLREDVTCKALAHCSINDIKFLALENPIFPLRFFRFRPRTPRAYKRWRATILSTHILYHFPINHPHLNLSVKVFVHVSPPKHPHNEGATLKHGEPSHPSPFSTHQNALLCDWLAPFDRNI